MRNRTRISKSPFPPNESKSKILRGYCGDQLPLEVLFRLDRLGLWPNDPVREHGHVRGRLTKVEMEVALQEELKGIYSKLKPSTSEHLSEVAWNIPIPLICCFKGTLWQREGQMLDKGWERRITNICKSCYLHIKCFLANSLAAVMWRWCLNSKQAVLQLVVEGSGRCEMGQGEAPITWFTRVRWEWYKNHGI